MSKDKKEPKEYLKRYEGWNTGAFRDTLEIIDELIRLKYEIENCVRTMSPTTMVDELTDLFQRGRDEMDML